MFWNTLNSPFCNKHAAVLLYKGESVSIGYNWRKDWFNGHKGIHAEVDAIRKCPKHLKSKLSSMILIVVRLGSLRVFKRNQINGCKKPKYCDKFTKLQSVVRFSNSKPCEACSNRIAAEGITKVIWSTLSCDI
jgi:tRNA(Arg) A34 adenosine deaminase TadA